MTKFEYNNNEFLITKSDGQYIVSSKKNIAWINLINRYCVEKNPTEKQIISKIKKYMDKHNNHGDNNSNNSNNKSTPLDTLTTYYDKKNKLMSIIDSSKSRLIEDTKIKNIYDKKIIGNIIIDEFMSCLKSGIDVNIKDNIYIWEVYLNKFDPESEINKSMTKHKLSNITMQIQFDEYLYPMYPPAIKILSPKLIKSLNSRISNSKITQLNYWTPTRKIKTIINKITDILNKFGIIESIISQKHKKLIDLEICLLNLSTLINLETNDPIDEDEKYEKYTFTNSIGKITNKKSQPEYWKSGTGYGYSGAVDWDPDEYINLRNDKDKQISNVLEYFLACFKNIVKDELINKIDVYNIINESLLPKFIQNEISTLSLLEVHERSNLYKQYTKVLDIFSDKDYINLLNNFYENFYNIKNIIYNSIKINKKLENNLLQEIHDVIEKICDTYSVINAKKNSNDNNVGNALDLLAKHSKNCSSNTLSLNHYYNDLDRSSNTLSLKDYYKEKLSKYCAVFSDDVFSNLNKKYTNLYEKYKNENWSACLKRLSYELPSLNQKGNVPIDISASIFFKIDEIRPMIMKILITGPTDTPYDSGCFIFDVYVPHTYPKSPPDVLFVNTGGHIFNPNLHSDGNICLSILGTYVGAAASASEKWNPKTSTLLQIMISIQSQILVEEPYYNESYINNTDKRRSIEYNKIIQLYTLKNILDLLKNPKKYPQFTEIIKTHFLIKKDYIKKMCKVWEKDNKNIDGDLCGNIISYLDNL